MQKKVAAKDKKNSPVQETTCFKVKQSTHPEQEEFAVLQAKTETLGKFPSLMPKPNTKAYAKNGSIPFFIGFYIY